MPTPRLWSWRLSPFAGKARAAFAEKGVAFELLEIHPRHRPERLRELNPLNRVPVLELDGAPPVRESAAICEWLEDTHPEPPLWPADPALRGWARGWARWTDDNPTTNFFLGMRKLAFGPAPSDPEDIVEQMHGRLAGNWLLLEAALAEHDGPWLCGEQFTYADIGGMALAARLPVWAADRQPDPEAAPLTVAWMAALRERPSIAAIDEHSEDVLTASPQR